jgi:pilus assembly protein CpaE
MKDLARVVLVDPNEKSRDALQRLLRGISAVWLSEVVSSYEEATARAKEITAQLTIVTLDHDPNQGIDLVGKLTQANPESVVVPAGSTADSALILRAIRAGAREFLPLPSEPADVLETITRLVRGRNESQTAEATGARIVSVTGAGGGIGCTTLAVNLATTLAARKDQETILLDLDLIFGSVDAFLDITPDHTLTHVIQNFQRLDLTLLKRSVIRHG